MTPARKADAADWTVFRCYYCGRFLGMKAKIKWIDEPISVADRLDPPDAVPVHRYAKDCPGS